VHVVVVPVYTIAITTRRNDIQVSLVHHVYYLSTNTMSYISFSHKVVLTSGFKYTTPLLGSF
jgi:uncharacterized protein YbcV (DUF1398 family)